MMLVRVTGFSRLIVFVFHLAGFQVAVVAKQLVLQQDAQKFEALSFLHYLLAASYSVCVILNLQGRSYSLL